ncbi:MAG TPA: alpha/beta fold hydrolase, partial [Nonomuraea sp.]|nr:alpha/beta fold hydrolase [Nonomuraea sp.]
SVNSADGAVRDIFRPSPATRRQVMLTSPATGRMVLAVESAGVWRLAHAGPRHPEPRLAVPLDDLAGDLVPLAFSPAGRHVLLRVQDGLRSGLLIYDLDGQAIRTLPTPDGAVGGPAVWTGTSTGETVRCLFVSASEPFRMLTLDPDRPGRWSKHDDGTTGNASTRWAPARVEMFPGGDGPIEAIVHGDEDWRTCRRVVVALHGGPQRAWTMKFHQLFQYLGAYGITVIAPNPRGSSGYGDRHRDAIRGAWAGPDLADLLALNRHVRAERDPADPLPMLYGQSYGAYLALVAAAAEPSAWARAVAVAPFLSGARLRAEASAEVRAMLDRLGACRDIGDGLGPRDVIRLAGRIRARLLIAHGADDQVVPVGQSRALRVELLRLGRREGADFRYREVPGAGHNPLDGSYRMHAEVASFLAGGE